MRLLRLAIEFERWDLAAYCLVLGALRANGRVKEIAKSRSASKKTGRAKKQPER